jgi:hypothetical protein
LSDAAEAMMAKVVRYHITVLSNFARGYDKYARVYSKKSIPESTFSEQFFLLRREDVEIGVEKAQRLLDKLALPANRLIALETVVEESELHANNSTGLGQYVQSSSIHVHDVHTVEKDDGTWRLDPLCVEEASALSLRLLHPTLLPFVELQPRTFSILPIAKGCQASCPFCFSEASVSAAQEQSTLGLSQVAAFARAARHRGASRFVITGGGEPGLVSHTRLLDFIRLGTTTVGKSILITNGHHLTKLDETQRIRFLSDYATAGLSVLAISHHHHDEATNERLMNLLTPVKRVVETWRNVSGQLSTLHLRFICVLQRGGIEDVDGLRHYIDWATCLGVTEICFKELYVSTSVESVYHDDAANVWSYQHQTPLSIMLAFARDQGWEELDRLPWGAPVFKGLWRGRPVQIAAYTEPSLFWERTHGIARSWNLMADGRCLVSLEDRGSELSLTDAT